MTKPRDWPASIKIGLGVLTVAAPIFWALADHRGLPAKVTALSVGQYDLSQRIVRDSLRISDHAATDSVMRCLVLQLFEKVAERRPERCSR